MVLLLQLIMNIANSNNNESNNNNNNNNNDNNNNNINEGITVLLNEYTNDVMATGSFTGGKTLFKDDDFQVFMMLFGHFNICIYRRLSQTGIWGWIRLRRMGKKKVKA